MPKVNGTGISAFEPRVLPNGTTIKNSIAKAAMEENMAGAEHAPSAALMRLYAAWAAGGAGLILTGNVMIDRRAMTGSQRAPRGQEHHAGSDHQLSGRRTVGRQVHRCR